MCEPVDLPVNKRHLDMVYAHMRLSDKPFMGSVTHPERAADTVAMCEILFGKEFVDEQHGLHQPHQRQFAAGVGRARCSARPRPTRAPTRPASSRRSSSSGAMSPVTVAGTLTQVLAEVHGGHARFCQLARPGAPVIFGTFVSTLSMQSGAPTFGTPEAALAIYGAGQLARRMNMPFRTGGSLCASKMPDAQAAYESAQTLLPTLFGGHQFRAARGRLDGGRALGVLRKVRDGFRPARRHARARQGRRPRARTGRRWRRSSRSSPGGHFLGCAHTQANFETAFYRSSIADNNSVEQWIEEGSKDAATRANAVWKKMLAEYEPPPIDPGIDEALREFIERKKASMPDANY